MPKVVIVGAGSAGCVVAAELSEDRRNDVLLLDAGPDRTVENRPRGLRSLSYLDAVDEDDAFWPDFAVSFRSGEPDRPYLKGIGVGGSAAVNGMIALPGLPGDYDRWRDKFGCAGWGWDSLRPYSDDAMSHTRPVGPEELSPVGRTLLESASEIGLADDLDLRANHSDPGAGRLWLNADRLGRRSSAEIYLDPARARPNLRVRGDAPVHGLEWRGDRAAGVRLEDGSILPADHVVLCAGTFGSAEILLRSAVSRRGVGKNLRDHPAVRADLALRDPTEEDRGKPTLGAALRTSSSHGVLDLHLVSIDGRIWGMAEKNSAALLLCLQTVRSTGRLSLDSSGRRRIDLNLLADERDGDAFLQGVALMSEVLGGPAFDALATSDVEPAALAALHERTSLEEWLPGRLGQLLHAVGTCRMGDPADDDAVTDVDGRVIGRSGVSVIDASVMPDIPAANTHIPTVTVALKLARGLRAELAAES